MKRNITRLLLSAVLMMCCTVSALAQLGIPPNDEIWYTSSDGSVIEPYDKNVFGATYQSNTYDANGHGTIKFNGSVTSIGEYAFYQCSNLTSITIPNRVTNIGQSAFESCSGLNSVTIPNSVTNIGQSAFESCSNLSSVTIPNSVTSIGAYAFQDCVNLHDVFFLGKNNITLGEDVFYRTFATIYVGDKTKFPETWGGRPVRSWRSGKGDGTRESPYEIENYVNLYGFSLEVLQGNTSICGKLTADITANNNVLKADGTLNAGVFKPWEPIGSWGGDPIIYNGYSGEFNGNGHTISGLYCEDTGKNNIGLFGKANNGAYIHDLGLKDSYFSGNSWVAGICGDFGGGRIENCWNAATVISNSNNSDGCCAGGIAASCWTDASVKGCYNIGKVTAQYDTQCGGICGVVNSTVRDCVTLDVCNAVCKDLRSNALIINVAIKDINAFKSGEVCWLLNNGVTDGSQKWFQTLETDDTPSLSTLRGTIFKITDDQGECEYANAECQHEQTYKSYQAAVCPTATTTGRYGHWHCSHCGKDFFDEQCTVEATEENLTVPVATNKEIWYTTSNNQKLTPNKTDVFGVTYNDANNVYEYGLGVIRFEDNVTSIGNEAFYQRGSLTSITIPESVTSIGNEAFMFCRALTSITIPSSVTSIGEEAIDACISITSIDIPSSVTSIGKWAIYNCWSLSSVTFHSLPTVGENAFDACDKLSANSLDLTDNEKPHIGTSLDNYPGFTEARYHRTLANDGTTWGTITLPFVPASTEGLKFYTLKDATSDKVVLTEVTDIKAGVPYLFKNCGENAEFTLTATDPTVVVNPVDQEAINGMKLVGAFRKDEFTGDGTKYGLYGGNTFMTTTGTLTINPFRAYLETTVSGAKAIVIDNEADGIDDIRHLSPVQSQEGVNVQGMRVGNNYKGIVIKNGKKYLNR